MDQQQPEQHSKFKSFLVILFVVLFMGGISIAINWDLIKILFHAGQNAYETLSQDNAPSIDNLNINTIIESGLDKDFDDTLSIDMQDNYCLDFFKLIFSDNCQKLEGEAQTACQHIPLFTTFHKRLAVELNYCKRNDSDDYHLAGSIDNYVPTAMRTLQKTLGEEKINVFSSKQGQKEIAELADQLDSNLLVNKPLWDGIMLDDDKIPQIESDFADFYAFAQICKLNMKICPDIINIKKLSSDIFRQLKLILTRMDAPKYEAKIKEDYELQKQVISLILDKIFIYYYKTGNIPEDMLTLLKFTDFSCNDPELIKAVKDFELTKDHPLEFTQEECRKLRRPQPKFNDKLQEPINYISKYDVYSFLYLEDNQKYFYTNTDGKIELCSAGLDRTFHTKDDITISTTVENLHALRPQTNE